MAKRKNIKTLMCLSFLDKPKSNSRIPFIINASSGNPQ